ncbi:MAG: hypothetical protein EOP19_27445, partial [Hyphomicrobiales bacterium]
VVLTRQSPSGLISETIVRNVKVLAIDLRLGETGSTGAAPNPDNPNQAFQTRSIATLELDPQQGEAVINAAQVGTVSLSLRSIADFAPGADEGTRRSNQNIRLIRFGNDSTVIAGQNDASVAPVEYSENPENVPPVRVTE